MDQVVKFHSYTKYFLRLLLQINQYFTPADIPEFWHYGFDCATFPGHAVYVHIILRVQDEVSEWVPLYSARVLEHKLLVIRWIDNIRQGHLQRKINIDIIIYNKVRNILINNFIFL